MSILLSLSYKAAPKTRNDEDIANVCYHNEPGTCPEGSIELNSETISNFVALTIRETTTSFQMTVLDDMKENLNIDLVGRPLEYSFESTNKAVKIAVSNDYITQLKIIGVDFDISTSLTNIPIKFIVKQSTISDHVKAIHFSCITADPSSITKGATNADSIVICLRDSRTFDFIDGGWEFDQIRILPQTVDHIYSGSDVDHITISQKTSNGITLPISTIGTFVFDESFVDSSLLNFSSKADTSVSFVADKGQLIPLTLDFIEGPVELYVSDNAILDRVNVFSGCEVTTKGAFTLRNLTMHNESSIISINNAANLEIVNITGKTSRISGFNFQEDFHALGNMDLGTSNLDNVNISVMVSIDDEYLPKLEFDAALSHQRFPRKITLVNATRFRKSGFQQLIIESDGDVLTQKFVDKLFDLPNVGYIWALTDNTSTKVNLKVGRDPVPFLQSQEWIVLLGVMCVAVGITALAFVIYLIVHPNDVIEDGLNVTPLLTQDH